MTLQLPQDLWPDVAFGTHVANDTSHIMLHIVYNEAPNLGW